MSSHRSIHFVALGCPKNRVDTEMLASVAREEGWEPTADPLEARIIVVGTCAFIEEARKESIETILALADARLRGRCTRIVVAGCMAERYAAEIARELPEVDDVVGLGKLEQFRRLLGREGCEAGATDDGATETERRVLFPSARYGRLLGGPPHTAYLKIGEGCSRRCAFCAIPAIRGRAVSRPERGILEEARGLARAGVKEICLVSQDTAAWGADLGSGRTLARLVEKLARVEGLDWIRILYLYPGRSVTELADVIASGGPVVPYLDIPLQHGSDRMLKLMRRGHGRDFLDRMVDTLRKHVPGLVLRTTFIVGHPGETSRDVEALLEMMAKHRPERVGILRWSAEEGTASERMDPGYRVSRAESLRRYRQVAALARKLQIEQGRAMIGRVEKVMIDGPSAEGPYLYDGRLETQAPEVDGKVILARAEVPLVPGQIVQACIRRASGPDLIADLE